MNFHKYQKQLFIPFIVDILSVINMKHIFISYIYCVYYILIFYLSNK